MRSILPDWEIDFSGRAWGEVSDCIEQCAAMSNDGDAQILQVLRREAGKQLFRDSVLTQSGLVLLKTKAPQPACHVHDTAALAQLLYD
jgi:hypothetical protein